MQNKWRRWKAEADECGGNDGNLHTSPDRQRTYCLVVLIDNDIARTFIYKAWSRNKITRISSLHHDRRWRVTQDHHYHHRGHNGNDGDGGFAKASRANSRILTHRIYIMTYWIGRVQPARKKTLRHVFSGFKRSLFFFF